MMNPSEYLESGFSFGGPLEWIFPTERKAEFAYSPLQSVELGSDRYWMLEALKVSQQGIGLTNPNPSVGCVLVDADGHEISRGFTQAYPGAHAEKMAFDAIADVNRLEGATAYVTLEPCSHFGRQAPCVDLFLPALGKKGIKRVVIARGDPNPLVNGKGLEKLRAAGISVEVGLFAAEASAWNYPFLSFQNLKRTIFALKWAQTLDGQLVDDSGRSQWISGPCARSYTHWLRQRYDGILVGGRTVLTDFPGLTARDCALPLQKNPIPIIFDPQGLCLEVEERVQEKLKSSTFLSGKKILFLTTEKAFACQNSSWITQQQNVQILQLPGKSLIPECVQALNEQGLQSVMIEGGPRTLTSFIKAGFADLLHVMVCPVMTGGYHHRVHIEQLLANAQRFELISTSRLGNDVVMEMAPTPLATQIFGSL